MRLGWYSTVQGAELGAPFSLETRLLPGEQDALGQRYIGSKLRLATWITGILGEPSGRQTLVDPFCGTGILCRRSAQLGWTIRASDNLYSATVMTRAQLADEIRCTFEAVDGYDTALKTLSKSPKREGFIWREYSPSGRSMSGHIRFYFTPENAARVDAIRERIREWRETSCISPLEEAVLIADLLSAANRVANTAGTYGCFLQPWHPNAKRPLTLARRPLLSQEVQFSVTCADASEIETQAADVAYFDPPYTKRQYAAYYHLLETIAVGDTFNPEGVTGLRPWKAKSSDFCYKRRAKHALKALIEKLSCNRILLSYNSEGHLDLNEIQAILSQFGSVRIHGESQISRYTPNGKARRLDSSVGEFVFDLRREP